MRSIELVLSPQGGPPSPSTITVYAYAPAPGAAANLSQTVFVTVDTLNTTMRAPLTPAEARILANDLLLVAAQVDQQYERPQRNAADESAGAIVEHECEAARASPDHIAWPFHTPGGGA